MTVADENGKQAQRKAAMAVLAHSDAAEIARRLEPIAVPAYENLREPENGLVMLRGRIGGDGAPFNLGEATVSRAAVRLATGEVGFGYTLGRDGQKAQMIALCDALVQSDEFSEAVEAKRADAAACGDDLRTRSQGCGDRGDAGRFLHDGAR